MRQWGTPVRIAGWSLAALALLAPLAAMQFTDEVEWTVSDFVFMGLLMGGVGLVLELAARRAHSGAYRAATALAAGTAFLLVWANAAVGVIGDGTPAGMLYPLVPAMALLGAVIGRFRAAGMARAMAAAAVGQALVPLAAAVFHLAPIAKILAPEVPVATVVFAGLWLASAALFRRAAREAT